MKASELIERLTKLIEENGDAEVTLDGVYSLSEIKVHHWVSCPIVKFELY